MEPHEPNPHFFVGGFMEGERVALGSGEWGCYTCKKPLKGTYLNPKIPWEHRELQVTTEPTVLPGLGTTE